ncbi:hypothetical protein C482_18160 [Natrialba chahannaoensis JCM 10990]|uniref:Uncharacterized protein n=2 Tax=Natrialba chahannaoensis TaxID=68911 RepID=M0A7H9_9EURY|nr:hypothetical protein C482_18160 [Natrialba chahannaoensis JCM 10990]
MLETLMTEMMKYLSRIWISEDGEIPSITDIYRKELYNLPLESRRDLAVPEPPHQYFQPGTRKGSWVAGIFWRFIYEAA